MPVLPGEQLVLLLSALALASPRQHAASGLEFFEQRVRPVLVERCYECHGEKKQKGGLRLDSASAVLKGGDSGAALVSGQPEQSLLIKVISWSDPDLQMPPKNKLADAEIDALTEWVKMGAPDPRTNLQSQISNFKSPPTNHWAYQPLKKFAPPATKDFSWPRTDIDRLITGRLMSSLPGSL